MPAIVLPDDGCAHSPIRPYRAKASAKMRIRIIPTKSLGCCAFALQHSQAQGARTMNQSRATGKQGAPARLDFGGHTLHTHGGAGVVSTCTAVVHVQVDLGSPHASVTHDANSHASCQTSEPASQARGQMCEAIEEQVRSRVHCGPKRDERLCLNKHSLRLLTAEVLRSCCASI